MVELACDVEPESFLRTGSKLEPFCNYPNLSFSLGNRMEALLPTSRGFCEMQ